MILFNRTNATWKVLLLNFCVFEKCQFFCTSQVDISYRFHLTCDGKLYKNIKTSLYIFVMILFIIKNNYIICFKTSFWLRSSTRFQKSKLNQSMMTQLNMTVTFVFLKIFMRLLFVINSLWSNFNTFNNKIYIIHTGQLIIVPIYIRVSSWRDINFLINKIYLLLWKKVFEYLYWVFPLFRS